ncbi:YbhN family protein [Acidocella sp.]|uniref:lysylphosphatidylglycerol synthase transmembrane domain-containing protein n=1 Tax=Acidocella sp. TaxID=50710 RepID=UPI002611D389|nr:YbhN family protein [Acidocella sp.]
MLAALQAISRHDISHALLLLGLSACIMCAYDLPGITFARRIAKFPRLGLHRIGLASFCAYALSHVLGAPALSAAAIRLRLYAQWGVPPAGIARIIALSGSTFAIGLAAMLGLLLLFAPHAVPVFGHAAPVTLRFAGALLAGIVAAYVLAARGRESVTLWGRTIALPGARLALAQIILASADMATSAAILYALLPVTPGLSYPHVLSLYLAAFASGALSGLPAGVGVFDSVVLLGLSAYLPPASALGAILLFRVMYFLAPACLAGICYAGHELWMQTRANGDAR